ncbi:MAG: sulfatase [Candidatus Brocadiia bacterium]
MNFIFIISDTLRRDHLGCYGNDWISTPHIDRFAENSLLFLNAYSASFPTVPHRRDVLTGRYTASYTGWAPLSGDEVVLPQVLGPAGYTSMMVADTPHILENGYHYDRAFDGFEWIRGQESDRWKTAPEAPEHACDPDKLRNPDMLRKRHRRNAEWWRYESDTCVARTMTEACRWLEENYRRENFFLYVDTFDPHEPWDPPQWYVDMYDPGYEGDVVDYPLYSRTDFLSQAELKHARACYAGEVSLVDRWVGRVLEKVEDLGLLEDTVVLLTTDHGFLHGEHSIIGKSLIRGRQMAYIPLYEEITHIPLVVHYPGVGAGSPAAVVQPMDFMPTVLDLAGAEVPDTVHGESFAPVLRGETDVHREFAVASPYLDVWACAATVTCGKWSAILWSQPEDLPGAEDKAVDGFAKGPGLEIEREDMLFDLGEDPAQQSDVAADHPDVLTDLRRRAVKFWESIGTDEAILQRWRG